MDIYKHNFTIVELEIFSFLCIRAGEKFSQREISQALKASPTAVANAVKHLIAENFIKLEKTKTINFIMFNRDNKRAIELKRAENLKQIYVSGLSDFLEEQLAGGTIIIFGSYSKGEDTKTSDIDIAVIERKEKILDVKLYEKMLHRQININFYDSWRDVHKYLKNNILNGIILQGSVDL